MVLSEIELYVSAMLCLSLIELFISWSDFLNKCFNSLQ